MVRVARAPVKHALELSLSCSAVLFGIYEYNMPHYAVDSLILRTRQ